MDVVNVRECQTVKGRLIALTAGTLGKGAIAKSLHQTVEATEARNNTARTS